MPHHRALLHRGWTASFSGRRARRVVRPPTQGGLRFGARRRKVGDTAFRRRPNG
jgi:hypothetical protein